MPAVKVPPFVHVDVAPIDNVPDCPFTVPPPSVLNPPVLVATPDPKFKIPVDVTYPVNSMSHELQLMVLVEL